MRSLLQNYYKMSEEEKSKINDLLIIHMIETKMKEYKELDLDLNDEGFIFQIVKEVLKSSDVKEEKIIERIFEILNAPDTSIGDLADMDEDELIEIITDIEEETKNEKYEIIKEFMYKDYYCVFIRDDTKYILVFEKDNNSQVEIFDNIEILLRYVIKNKLLDFGEDVV